MACRNEDWLAGLTLRAAILWNDAVVVLLHECSDRSKEIVQQVSEENPGRIITLEALGEWTEMVHRDAMLCAARENGATHISIVDFDEIITSNLLDSIRSIMADLPRGSILELPGYNLRGSLTSYHANGIWGNRWFSVAFPDDPRLGWSGDRFHHREPMGLPLYAWRPLGQGQGGIMHLWGLNERRLIAKHAAYKMIEAVRWPKKSRAEIDNLYSLAFDPSKAPRFDQTWRFADTPLTWFADYGTILHHLHADAEPWQEQMCRELYVKHGPQAFSGLDLFGVCDPKPELVDA